MPDYTVTFPLALILRGFPQTYVVRATDPEDAQTRAREQIISERIHWTNPR